ncbi:hypothetical protein BDV95DRAFT_609355 [Massariosphaeria phaeospora]|uniref:F-box domain-containing protein n=1 Tax=Massariosphaeria phaeospora TaxID=100035 RepID=A0A7C8M6Y3_9PLEO|nr:hypothetical protein BDV95DRAFT_609355 [Massariosphaeria phaeospora]
MAAKSKHKSSQEDYSLHRQSLLLRDLEVLLQLNPRALSSNLLAIPKKVREQILGHVVRCESRPELHTCLWGADMVHEPWRHDIFGYAPSVPTTDRIQPGLLLINRQIRNELLEIYFRRSNLTLHAELRNTRENNWHFDYSPHVLKLPMLKHVRNVRFYVESFYVISKNEEISDQVHITNKLVQAVDTLLAPLQEVENIELVILFFWTYRSGKVYSLSMKDLFALEDVFKQHAEQRWLQMLHSNNTVTFPSHSAGVGYKLSSELKGTEQSGGMEIYIAQDLENATQSRRKSNLDFYGNYGISDPLPQPSYQHGAMI